MQKKDQIIYLKLSYDSQNYWWNEQNTNTNSKNEQSSVISKGGENYMMEFQEIQKYDQNQQNKKLNYQNSLFYYQSVNESSSMADEQNDKTIKIKQFKANEKLNKSEQIKQYQYSSTKIQEKSTKLVYQDKRIQENDYQNNKIHTNLLLELKRQLKNMNYQVKENKEEIGDGFALRATKYIRQEKIQNYLVLTKFIKIENSNKKIIKKLEFLQLLQETTKYVKIEDSFQISSNNHPQQIIFVIILLEFKNTYNFLLKIEKIIDFFKENKYYLGKYIAEGGYGVIFDGKIYQNNKIQEIIFKIQFADEQNINQSEEEYNIMKGFEKNIYLINAIDYKKIDENVSVILKEKCECDLNSKLKQLQQNNQFSFTQLLQIIFDLIDGLILLRAYKIIHLDIKPSNILINHYGIHVFSDFGTSYKNKNDQSIQVKGFTPYYAPQEVLKGENNINYQSDAFSIGKTLEIVFNHYEMLNKFNKNEKNMIEKFKQILKDYALREQVSERKTCLELHKAFYEAVIFEGYLEFSESYIDKIRLILSQSCGDRNKDIYFFREVCIYYNEKILDLKQKIKKSHILSFVEIESLSESSLRKIDKISSQQDPECILIYNLIASLYNEQSQYDIEKKYLQKSLELCNELFKKGNLYTARTLNKLAFFHKKEVGLEYSLKSIQMVEDIIKGDNDFKAIYLNTLSWCYSSLNDHKQALKVQEETLKMRLSMFKLYHPRIALALINLGTKYQNFNLNKCLKYQLLSLKIRQFLYKENHPCIAQSLDYIGQCYLKMGNLEQAKKYLYRSYFMRRKIYQKDIDCIRVSLMNIARYHQQSGEFIKSIFFYKKYFQMVRNLNYDNIDYVYVFLYNIAQCLFFNRAFQQSIFILQYFLKIFSNDAVKVSKAHIIIGLCQLNLGQFQKSLESACNSISVDKNVFKQDIHKLSNLIKNIFKRYTFLGYVSLCLSLKDQNSEKFQNFNFKKYQYFLLMIYLLILEFQKQDQNQRFQLYSSILEITNK